MSDIATKEGEQDGYTMKSEPMPDTSSHHPKNRIVLFLRLWAHGREQPVWIGEVQDIATGETIHTQNLEALFDWLKQKTSQELESSTKKEK